MPILQILRWTALATILSLSLCACQSDTQQKMPSFKTVTIQGAPLSNADLEGKVSIINFWATSCSTCVKEMPEMMKAYGKFKSQGLQFVAIAMAYDPPMYVVNFAKTRELPFTVALDSDGSAAKAFGKVQLTPTTFVINKYGRVIKRYVGEPDWSEFDNVLTKALAES